MGSGGKGGGREGRAGRGSEDKTTGVVFTKTQTNRNRRSNTVITLRFITPLVGYIRSWILTRSQKNIPQLIGAIFLSGCIFY